MIYKLICFVLQERGIGIINACSVAMGLLTPSGPQPWHPAQDEIKDAAKQAHLYCQVGSLGTIIECLLSNNNIVIGNTKCQKVVKNYSVFVGCIFAFMNATFGRKINEPFSLENVPIFDKFSF